MQTYMYSHARAGVSGAQDKDALVKLIIYHSNRLSVTSYDLFRFQLQNATKTNHQ